MIDRRWLLATLTGAVATPALGGARRSSIGSLDGLWSMGSWTDLERPPDAPHLVLSPAEAEAFMAPRRALGGMLAAKPGEVGQAENEYIDRGDGLARVKGELRSSWIVEPADGRIPYRPEVFAKLEKHRDTPLRRFDDPEELAGTERCVASIGAGAPLIGGPDSNLLQIVDTGACVAILVEKYHDVRVIHCGGPEPAGAPATWLGNSVGRWEGRTLVVETRGFRPGINHRGQRTYETGETEVSERFTRAGPKELFYEFTVRDPSIYTQPWRGEMVFRAQTGRIFEYACHEGNYSLPGMLAGARQAEREAAAPQAKPADVAKARAQ